MKMSFTIGSRKISGDLIYRLYYPKRKQFSRYVRISRQMKVAYDAMMYGLLNGGDNGAMEFVLS